MKVFTVMGGGRKTGKEKGSTSCCRGMEMINRSESCKVFPFRETEKYEVVFSNMLFK